MEFTFGLYRVDVDVEKTKNIYKRLPLVSESCPCEYCSNYEAAADNLHPDIHAFFNSIGADIKKPTEVYVNYENDDGTIYYGGFYHVCGTLLSHDGDDASSIDIGDDRDPYEVCENFRVSFQPNCDLLEDEFPAPVLQIEIREDVPWVLPEDPST